MTISFGLLTFFLIIGLLALGALLHKFYLDRIYNKLSSLSGEPSQLGTPAQSWATVSKESVFSELYLQQGSTFNALAIGAWSLFFIALTFFYFLTPVVFGKYNYFRLATLASSLFGFFIFGLIVFLLTGALAVILSRIYGFYEISIAMKKSIMTTFALLGVSVICSAYLGTIYPARASFLLEAFVFTALLISLLILLAPIYIGAAKVMR